MSRHGLGGAREAGKAQKLPPAAPKGQHYVRDFLSSTWVAVAKSVQTPPLLTQARLLDKTFRAPILARLLGRVHRPAQH